MTTATEATTLLVGADYEGPVHIICIDCYPTCKDERALCGAEIENHDHLAEGVGDECVVCAYLWESHWCCTEENP